MSVVRFGIPDKWQVDDPRAKAWRESRFHLGTTTSRFSRFPSPFRERLKLWQTYPRLLRRRGLVVLPGDPLVNCHGTTFGADGWLTPGDEFWWRGAEKSEHLGAWRETLDGFGYREFNPTSSDSVALYCDPLGYVTHSARRLGPKSWGSKLGQWVSLQGHRLEDLEDACYGKVSLVLSR